MYFLTGGRDSPCDVGYEGDFCAACAPGYYDRNGYCTDCEPDWLITILFAAQVRAGVE